MLAGQQLTQKPYENHFLFQKECGWPYNFCREADNVGWTNCPCILHARVIIFCTHNQTMFIINNIKKISIKLRRFNITNCMHKNLNIVIISFVFMLFNKIKLMQVNRRNILKTTGMLCNPNFINNRIINILV